jgi:hypothetical protein
MATTTASPGARPALAEWRAASGGSTGPGNADLPVYQGDGFSAIVEIVDSLGAPADLTGYTVLAQIRNGPADRFPQVVMTLTTTIVSPNIILSLTPAQTTQLGSQPLFYDLELTGSNGIPTTVLTGSVNVTLEISRLP